MNCATRGLSVQSMSRVSFVFSLFFCGGFVRLDDGACVTIRVVRVSFLAGGCFRSRASLESRRSLDVVSRDGVLIFDERLSATKKN